MAKSGELELVLTIEYRQTIDEYLNLSEFFDSLRNLGTVEVTDFKVKPVDKEIKNGVE